MKKVLLTNAYVPHEALGWGENMLDVLSCRLSRGHGMFTLTSHMHTFALYLIAENLRNPCTVLEHPHWDDFVSEIRKGYDVIAIQIKSLHAPKIAKMIRTIREEAPNSEIVIGGYGVSSLFAPMPGDKNGDGEYIRENADHLCRDEGVRFMRRLLGDAPVDRPINQYYLPTCGFSAPGFQSAHVRIPAFLVSLGCPSACDFCNTSAFYYHKKIYVAEPAQIYDFMKAYQRRLKADTMNVILFDEDMYLNPEYVRELGRLIRSDKKTWGIRWFSFGSVRALSQYEPEELRECGAGAVWIGVESSLCSEEKAGYVKREGTKTPEQVFEGLHRVGIQTVGSMILGFDFHNRDNIEKDIDYFVSLKPFLYQIGPLTPCPGTKLYEKMLAEGRVLDHYNYTDFHLWKDNVYQLANFEQGSMKHYFDLAHEKLRTQNGPPVVQLFEDNVLAYETFKDSKSEFLRYQAEVARRYARGVAPLLTTIKHHPPSPEVVARIRGLEERAKASLGAETLPQKALRKAVETVYDMRMDYLEAKGPQKLKNSDPPTRWTYYHQNGREEPVVRRGSPRAKAEPVTARRPGSRGTVQLDLPPLTSLGAALAGGR